jgi:hypothetical protein
MRQHRKPHFLAAGFLPPVGRTMPGCPVDVSRRTSCEERQGLARAVRSASPIQENVSCDDLRPVNVGVRRMPAMQATEFGLGFAVAAVHEAARLALLRGVTSLWQRSHPTRPVSSSGRRSKITRMPRHLQKSTTLPPITTVPKSNSRTRSASHAASAPGARLGIARLNSPSSPGGRGKDALSPAAD